MLNIQIHFPTRFRLWLSLECFSEVSRKFVQSVYRINSLEVNVLLPKSDAKKASYCSIIETGKVAKGKRTHARWRCKQSDQIT